MATELSPAQTINKFRSIVAMLADSTVKDDLKLKATQEISESFEQFLTSSVYQSFLDHLIKVFIKVLQEGEPHFISEYNIQQVRKLILEMLYRLHTNEALRPYVKPILSLMLKLLEIDNEENVILCLKIIIELHKQYRPAFNTELQHFLQFVKNMYSELPSHINKIFEPRPPIKVKDLSELNIEELLKETFTTTMIQTEKRKQDQTTLSYNLIPKAVLSLKVIQDLPIIVVLLYQLYKQSVYKDVCDFIPLIMTTITLQPTQAQRQSESFNKEIFVDFMGAQIKTLSFLAYIIKIYQDVVANHAAMLVQGMLGLLTLCPMEVAHLRRELLIASRHILATDLRNKFVPHIERLFDEDVLLGRGWTTHESLRPLAYSTLADLVHHVRQQLTLSNIARAVHLFSKNVHDDSLATTIQTMSCKLLLNLVDCIRHRAEVENVAEGKELLMRMLEVFVLKFKTIAKIQLPRMIDKYKQQQAAAASVPTLSGIDIKSEIDLRTQQEILEANLTGLLAPKEEKSKFGFPQTPIYNVSDYRSLVKTLVCGVKTITWGYATCKPQTKQFSANETLVFIRLVKWALKALDVYTLNCGPLPVAPQARLTQQNVRSKEEKEVLEHFSSVFTMMNAQTFHEIFSTTIEYIVERVYKNPTLQIVPNTLLANPSTSPIFATVLVEYLLERMEEMGSNQERSNLYLRLFKLVFGSVSLFPQENENMLRPHLHQIVNRSMELAMGAKEPYNYFLLLRALFRSIGGGSHDLLYQEFLPLLPNLLEGLNRLQSGLHKVHMKDLFVELCLTVPVRLSSLLPYLPMLMDPLVSALNGSNVLVSQGLRTLELCVDNLQHDFLYEHIQPVRAELMQALWRTLRNNTQEQIAQVAFKVLGKFGGGNRKMMTEPQKLEYVEYISNGQNHPAVEAYFKEQEKCIEFPVQRVVETAFTALKQSSTDTYYRKQAWEALHCYLAASIDLTDDKSTLINLFMHDSYQDGSTVMSVDGSAYKSIYKQARETHQTALVGMFIAAAIKDIRISALQTMYSVVRHYTMVAIAQESGAFAVTPRANEQVPLDPMVLVDALFVIMGHEEKELCKPGEYALSLIVNTATTILGSKDSACRLPFIEYLSERMVALCYERSWFAKVGGCKAIEVMLDKCARKWVYEHMFTFLKALLFVMMDLTGEVSSGALDSAKQNLEKLLTVCVTPPPENADNLTKELQTKALNKVVNELVSQVTSPHTIVREQCMSSLRLIADRRGVSVTEVMEPFKDVLVDMVPPRKHLLKHQPANAQMGLMDGNMFCTSLNPRLFSMDMTVKEHKLFITDLLSLCNTEDAKLPNFSCYKNINNFIPLRVSALKALAACHYLEADIRDQIFQVLYKTLEGLNPNQPNPELQRTAFECMKTFIAGNPMEKDLVHKTIRPLLMTLGDAKSLNLNGLRMLSYLTRLFPKVFNEKLCDQLLEILKQLMESFANIPKAPSAKGEEEQKIITVISIFHQTPAASSKFIRQLCQYTLQTEQALYIEASSPFREDLMKFLLIYPLETLEMLTEDSYVKEAQYSRFLHFLINHKNGKPLRDMLQTHLVHRLITLVLSNISINMALTQIDKNEFQYQAIRIVSFLIKFDDRWLSEQQELVDALKRVWCNDSYQERHKNVDTLDFNHWKEPKLLVKILLHYFCHHPNDIDLLFELLRATTDRFIPDFQFLRDFLENTVAQNYTVEWKRSAFFRFVEHFTAEDMSQELIAKILQLVIIPCFAVGFERGETNKLIGTAPAPYHDHPENIVSVFLNRCFAQVVDPDSPFPFADCVRISLLQFSCLLVEQASPHIHDHDATNKAQGFKLRRLMTFAWPCLLGKNCVDAATRYHGHLLLSHIIDKFAIHRKIVLQVFHSLLKAHGIEARNVVRQALEILTPSMPLRMEEGHKMLTHWTKKIIVDEGHSVQQLFHILQLVVKHYKVYYPVRHHLVQYMVNSIQRLGFSPTASLEHKRLAVELAEVIIKWELNGIKEEDVPTATTPTFTNDSLKRPCEDDSQQRKKFASTQPSTSQPVAVTKPDPDATKPIDKPYVDMVLNSLMRLACQVNDPPAQNAQTSLGIPPGEMLSRRCVSLLRTALKPDLWPQPTEINFAFYEKLLQTLETPNPNYANVCTGLELLTYLLTVLKKDQILAGFKLLQRRLGSCVTSSNQKIIKATHCLLKSLMSIFPSERTNSNVSCKYEELEILYSTVGKTVFEGLTSYEKNAQATPHSLYGPLMVLKAACLNNNSYIDLLITPFMRVLQKLQKEHLSPTTPENTIMTSELLVISLDLVKTRVVVMGVEMRKSFIGTILVGLIEKSPDVKIMRAITKILEEWMKNKNVVTLSQAPSLREKSILLVKMMQYIEKRFPDDQDLNAHFLELVNYVYTDEQLKQSELSSKLEQAFLSGLRSSQPHIRAKFFKVFDESMRRKLHDRILYILCSQNWDAIGPHYWIKQCIELLLATASSDRKIQMSHESCILPSVTSVVHQADLQRRTEFLSVKQENPSFYEMVDVKEEVMDIDVSNGDTDDDKVANRVEKVMKILSEHCKFLDTCRKITPEQFFGAAAQLCHMDAGLAESVWVQLFPRIWDILDDQQRQIIGQEISGFICSGTHIAQKDCHPSAINTFVEAMSRCNPPIPLAAPIMKYLGRSHNLWHRMTLGLEQMAFDPSLRTPTPLDFETELNPKQEIFTSLNEMYTVLCEEDMWAGMWQKSAHWKETNMAIAYEQHGFFEQAQVAYESVMAKYKQDFNSGSIPSHTQKEVLMWTDHWIRCAKELNQWDIIAEYSKNSNTYNAFALLESAWRVPNWDWVKEALANVEYSYHKELAWKVTLYGGFLLICNPESDKPLKFAEKYVETATTLCLNEWRRLPTVVSHIHVQYLQAAQQVMELQEAYQIHRGLLQAQPNSLHDMKAIVKTWRNRLPVIADDLSHWNDILTWRQHHYQFIVQHLESLRDTSNANTILGVHASAQSMIQFGKIARKHKLPNVCLDSLNRIYTINSVHILDCFHKIRQQVKSYVQIASMTNGGRSELQEGLEMINNTNVKYFSKEMTAEFYALKGVLYQLSNKTDDANKAFSVAVQLCDMSVKAWGLYGDYLEQVFTKDPRQIAMGMNAICCFLHACRVQNEAKVRKWLARVLWLLSYDDENGTLMEAVEKYSVGVPPILWVPWIPQLLNCLVIYDTNVILNLLCTVGRMFPQAVYFPIRTLYVTLRTAAARSKTTTAQVQTVDQRTEQQSSSNQTQETVSSSATSEAGMIKASPAMVRCSKIMKMLSDIHTTVLSSLEGIADQMEWFRENWYEEVLRQLRQGLAKCYAIAFENRESVNEAKITPHILNFVKKLVSTFGIGVENFTSSSNVVFLSAASQSLIRRAEATYQDPVFKEMKLEFTKDFDFTQQNAVKLHVLIFKLKKWIKILENRSKVLIQSFLIEEKCQYLANFTLKTGEVELPGEFLLPKHIHYFVKIARFMPKVDIVQKHNTSARRLYIRGHNGKIYPYLVVNDSGQADARREERVLQILRMLNHYLGRQKETARRFLNFTVPRVVAVSQQIRLIEDNPASVSLLDIFKKGCTKLNIEHDAPIHHYYERLANVQSRGIKASHQVYREILKSVQTNMVPRNLLKNWALATFPSATDYWQFRKMFTLQLSLACFAEYVLHLTRLNPDMMYIHQDSGMMNVAYFKFDIEDSTSELDTTRPVPFRLTPNITEFLSPIGISGPLTASMIATARCFVYPNFKVLSILRPILRDEMFSLSFKKKNEDTLEPMKLERAVDFDYLINAVNKAVNAISNRLNGLAHFDGVDSKVATLVAAANSHDNLCRMDPAWHPWL